MVSEKMVYLTLVRFVYHLETVANTYYWEFSLFTIDPFLLTTKSAREDTVIKMVCPTPNRHKHQLSPIPHKQRKPNPLRKLLRHQ